jgi:hypothetical protein
MIASVRRSMRQFGVLATPIDVDLQLSKPRFGEGRLR